jgi:hypothetical protein
VEKVMKYEDEEAERENVVESEMMNAECTT